MARASVRHLRSGEALGRHQRAVLAEPALIELAHEGGASAASGHGGAATSSASKWRSKLANVVTFGA